jgi:hypothetical protein
MWTKSQEIKKSQEKIPAKAIWATGNSGKVKMLYVSITSSIFS